jgi:hypothetical protein
MTFQWGQLNAASPTCRQQGNDTPRGIVARCAGTAGALLLLRVLAPSLVGAMGSPLDSAALPWTAAAAGIAFVAVQPFRPVRSPSVANTRPDRPRQRHRGWARARASLRHAADTAADLVAQVLGACTELGPPVSTGLCTPRSVRSQRAHVFLRVTHIRFQDGRGSSARSTAVLPSRCVTRHRVAPSPRGPRAVPCALLTLAGRAWHRLHNSSWAVADAALDLLLVSLSYARLGRQVATGCLPPGPRHASRSYGCTA